MAQPWLNNCYVKPNNMRTIMNKLIELTLAKETKSTYVYMSTDENPLITNLYLMKSQMPAEAPKKITVTVAFE